jgi:hypothetical protein
VLELQDRLKWRMPFLTVRDILLQEEKDEKDIVLRLMFLEEDDSDEGT